MKKVILITGSEIRHNYFRKYIAASKQIRVISSFCESKKGSIIEIKDKTGIKYNLRRKHLNKRIKVEEKFFEEFCSNTKDFSNPIFLTKGDINKQSYVDDIIDKNPDLIISYGCSIIKSKLLEVFKKKFINIHLGLSPYYRGSGTNFWPFVNNELQFVGTTFMHINSGIDTGKIIHQLRANMLYSDDIHTIGNRLIKDSVKECVKLIKQYEILESMSQINSKINRFYRKKDFDENSVSKAYNNINKNIIKKYLENKENIDFKFPIIKNKIV